MTFRTKAIAALSLALSLGRVASADEPKAASSPPPVPLTREDVKNALEGSKQATPRLPLPPLTEEQKARAAEAAKNAPDGGLGGGIVNNGRMRSYYLSAYNIDSQRRSGGPGREPDPNMTLGYPFQTTLFWIVSRGNNCTYCLGHQESKLAASGLTDDEIAALDGDWSEFDEAHRAAFAFTKKLSFAPQTINDADIDALRTHYNDSQITEIILSVAGFNAMNRWTGALRIPQEPHRVYLTPTSPKYLSMQTRIAPIGSGAAAKGLTTPVSRRRPALESRAEVEAALDAARTRTPRLKLADESATRAAWGDAADGPAPQWIRLLAVFPKAGSGRIASHLASIERGTLDARTKAIIAWVGARNDRAWYALGHARKRLHALGFSDAQIFVLDDPEVLSSETDREIVRFARKLTVDPALIDDEDVQRLRERFDDRKVAEIIYQVTEAAFFDRLTEASGLRLEE